MAVTQLTRWTGGNRDAVVAAAKKAKPSIEKLGGEFRLGQIHTGPYSGQWVTSQRFPDWETYGKAQQAMASDAAFQRMLAEVMATNPMTSRTVIAGIDL
jgi:hypothetical protein